jgi:hypothetical protein
MAKPYIHAEASVRRYGGKVEDYLPLHELMDSSKIAFPSNSHRTLTHNSWFAKVIIPKCFGDYIVNSAGKRISSEQLALDHIQEDFGGRFVPSVQDYLEHITPQTWFDNGKLGCPSSFKQYEKTNTTIQ